MGFRRGHKKAFLRKTKKKFKKVCRQKVSFTREESIAGLKTENEQELKKL
jgi:hypothetical protein